MSKLCNATSIPEQKELFTTAQTTLREGSRWPDHLPKDQTEGERALQRVMIKTKADSHAVESRHHQPWRSMRSCMWG